MNRMYVKSLPMPSRRWQIGRHGLRQLMAGLKFVGKALGLGAIVYALLILAFSF